MSLPFNPSTIAYRAKNIKGWSLLEKQISNYAIYDAIEDLSDHYSDWDSDQGFGSSDTTYALKYFLDTLISGSKLNLKTDFTPSLSIVEKV